MVINYWLNILMTCSPSECEDSLAGIYPDVGGTGDECGYVLFPSEKKFSNGAIAGIVTGVVGLTAIILGAIYYWRWDVDKLMDRLDRFDGVERTEGGNPTFWCQENAPNTAAPAPGGAAAAAAASVPKPILKSGPAAAASGPKPILKGEVVGNI